MASRYRAAERPPLNDHQPEAAYTYCDERGQTLFQVVRFPRKKFAQRRPDGRGGWVWNLDGVRPVLYRLDEVVLAEQVMVVEGEKDVETLRSLGIVATTNPGGANGWRSEYAEFLRGKAVVILPDQDTPGMTWARRIERDLAGVAASLKIINLPGLEFGSGGDVSDWLAAGHTKGELLGLIEKTPWIGPTVDDGATLVADIEHFIADYIVLPKAAKLPLALWTVGTFCFKREKGLDADLFDVYPYLAISSPTPRCGKSRVLEVVGLIVAAPLRTSNISEAALFRAIEQLRPTLLFDEAEIVQEKSERAQALRNVLNAGHRTDAVVVRCAPQGHQLQSFRTFGPKALAAVGVFPPTLRDRSILILMQRRTASEPIKRFRFAITRPEGEKLRERGARWVTANRKALAAAYDAAVLDFLPSDRDAENWGPLFALAAVACPERLEELRPSAEHLCAEKGDLDIDESEALQLVADLREIVGDEEVIPTPDILRALRNLEEGRWLELDGRRFWRLLRPFGVSRRGIRMGSRTTRGLVVADLEAPWSRYVAPSRKKSATQATRSQNNELSVEKDAATVNHVADVLFTVSPSKQRPVASVAAKSVERASGLDDAVAAMARRLKQQGKL